MCRLSLRLKLKYHARANPKDKVPHAGGNSCTEGDDGSGDDLLLLMQFPAGEIGRKVSLTLSPDVDDNDPITTPAKFRAREFPVGTGRFRFRLLKLQGML